MNVISPSRKTWKMTLVIVDLKVYVGIWVFSIVRCFKPLVKLNTSTSAAAEYPCLENYEKNGIKDVGGIVGLTWWADLEA